MDDILNKTENFTVQDEEIREARRLLWSMGNLYWKLDSTQKEMYDFYTQKTEKVIVMNASRRLGKSYLMLILAIECCLKNPKATVKFIQPTAKMLEDNLMPTIEEILEDCPVDLLPTYNTKSITFYFNNGSRLQLAGTDSGNYKKIRGGDCKLAIIDEAGFCAELKHIINYVLLPTTFLTRGRIILASTTPPDPSHDFITYMQAAQLKNTFIKRTILDALETCKNDPSPRININVINEAIESFAGEGGIHSDAYRTEYLCEIITDSKDSVVPEFTPEVEQDIVVEWKTPAYVDRYVSMDLGFQDMTAIIFGYYDFLNAVLVIQDEVMLKGQEVTAERVADLVRKKESEIWTDKLTLQQAVPYMRVSDNNLLFINDLLLTYDLQFIPTDKHQKDSYINKLRTMIANRRIIINPKCKFLIQHIKTAMWDKTRKSFKRSAADGSHYDFLDSLAYLVRNIDENRNPYPKNYKYANLSNSDSVFYAESYYRKESSSNLDKLAEQFKPKSSLSKYKSNSSSSNSDNDSGFSYFKKKEK